MNNQTDTTNELYFKDVFTQEGDNINMSANQLDINCITSKQNKFQLDIDGNLYVNSINTVEKNTSTEDIYELIYPIGSIYMNVTNVNPSTLFGGTWDQLKDKFLLGVGEKYLENTIGGEENHTLTIDEMPRHKHEIKDTVYNVKFGRIDGGSGYNTPIASGNGKSYGSLDSVEIGRSLAHNNIPPYITVYIWKRIS